MRNSSRRRGPSSPTTGQTRRPADGSVERGMIPGEPPESRFGRC
jgi:hypothetical protein